MTIKTDTTQNKNKTAIITGASAGLGRDFALLCAKDGYDVIMIARRGDRLEQLKADIEKSYDVKAYAYPCDLADADQMLAVVDNMQSHFPHIDIVINNAGFGEVKPFLDQDSQIISEMMMLNMATLTYFTHYFGQKMKVQGYGRILNVASVAGFVPGPGMALYFATKAYVLSLGEALSSEFEGHEDLHITTLCPGPTETEFGRRAGMNLNRMQGDITMKSMNVARIGYHAMMRGKAISVPGFWNTLMIALTRFAPRSFIRKIARKSIDQSS